MDLDNIPPYYMDMLAWWEFEEYVKRLNDRIERDNKQQKEQKGQQPNIPDYTKKVPNFNSMMNNLGKYKP